LPRIEQRARVLGIYGGLAGLAVAGGPLIGGAVTQGLDWHWIFWFNVPIGLIAAVLSPRFVPESFGPRVKLDLGGIALITAAVIGLVWGLTRGNDVGWASFETLASLAAGGLLLAGFVAWEARAAAPMLPLRLWRNRTFAASNATAFLAMGSISAGAYFAPQYLQLALGYGPFETGVRLLPFFLTPTLIAPFVAGVGISMTLPTIPTAILGAAGFALAGALVAPLIASRRDKEELWIASNATS
jgi:MFS family permease